MNFNMSTVANFNITRVGTQLPRTVLESPSLTVLSLSFELTAADSNDTT